MTKIIAFKGRDLVKHCSNDDHRAIKPEFGVHHKLVNRDLLYPAAESFERDAKDICSEYPMLVGRSFYFSRFGLTMEKDDE